VFALTTVVNPELTQDSRNVIVREPHLPLMMARNVVLGMDYRGEE
jgi:hypothetical protein